LPPIETLLELSTLSVEDVTAVVPSTGGRIPHQGGIGRHPRHGSSSGNGGVNCSISVGGQDVSKDTCNISKPKRVVAHIAQGEDDVSILLDVFRSSSRT